MLKTFALFEAVFMSFDESIYNDCFSFIMTCIIYFDYEMNISFK